MENTVALKAQKEELVSVQVMATGVFRIYGLPRGGRVHLKREMRDWVLGWDEITFNPFYASYSRPRAVAYCRSHGLTIQASCRS